MFIHYNFKLFLRLVLLKIYIHSSFSWILKHQSNLNCPSHFFSTNIFYLSFFFFCMIMNENYGWQQGVTLLTPFFFLCFSLFITSFFVVLCIVNVLYFFNVLCNVDWLLFVEWGVDGGHGVLGLDIWIEEVDRQRQ